MERDNLVNPGCSWSEQRSLFVRFCVPCMMHHGVFSAVKSLHSFILFTGLHMTVSSLVLTLCVCVCVCVCAA